MPTGCHQHREVPARALLRRPREPARRSRAEVRLYERVLAPRIDDRPGELRGLHEGVGHFARTSTWRYLRFASDGHHELYKIDTDPFEANNIAAQNPSVVSDFANKVTTWESA